MNHDLVVPDGVAGDLRLVVREIEAMTADVTALGIDAPDKLADRAVCRRGGRLDPMTAPLRRR